MVEAIDGFDACPVSLNERFDQEAYLVLSKIETVLTAAANGMDIDLGNINQLKDIYVDFENLHGELKLLNGIIKQRLPEVKKVTSVVDTITSLFCNDEVTVHEFSVVQCSSSTTNLPSRPNERGVRGTNVFKSTSCKDILR